MKGHFYEGRGLAISWISQSPTQLYPLSQSLTDIKLWNNDLINLWLFSPKIVNRFITPEVLFFCVHICVCAADTPQKHWALPQIRSDQSLSRVRLFATPWITARQASLSVTNSRSSLRLTSIESEMPSSHLILCRPLLLLPSIPPSIRVFSNESTLRMRWPKYWSFSFRSFLPKKSQEPHKFWSYLENHSISEPRILAIVL